MSRYDSLVLDHDGVIVDIMDEQRRRDGFQRQILDALPETNGMSATELTDELAFSVDPADLQSLSERLAVAPDQVWRARDDALVAVLKDAIRDGDKRPYPDVDVLADVTVPMGIASNNQQRFVEFVLSYHDLTTHFEAVRAREPSVESLDLKKPSPTFLDAVQRELDGSNPLYVGDKETDILAARRAGMDVALIRRDHNADRQLDAKPTYEVSTLSGVTDLVG